MTRDDVFKCIRLKSTFTVWRCVRNQIDALDFWGPNASNFQSCPCDQGLEIKKQMEGKDMGSKKEKISGEWDLPRYRAALKLKYEKPVEVVEVGKPVSAKDSSRKQYPKQEKPILGILPAAPDGAFPMDVQVSRDMLETFKDDHTIILTFDNGDEALLESLKATAKRFRREPSQQILWMLQYGLKYLDEFGARHVSDLSGVTK
jgi:hypothetical protein